MLRRKQIEKLTFTTEVGRRAFVRGIVGGLVTGSVAGEAAGNANIRGEDREYATMQEHFTVFAGLLATRTTIGDLLPVSLADLANNEDRLREIFTGTTIDREPDLHTRYRLLVPSEKENDGLAAAITASLIRRASGSSNFDKLTLKAFFEPDTTDSDRDYRLYAFDGRNLPRNDMLTPIQTRELASHVITDSRFDAGGDWIGEVKDSEYLEHRAVVQVEKSIQDNNGVTGVIAETSGHLEYTELRQKIDL